MTIVDILLYVMLLFGYVILLCGLILMVLSVFNFIKTRKYKSSSTHTPKISLIAPAHNEEKDIERTIKRFIDIEYPYEKKELVIINDGSKDETESIVARYAGKIIANDVITISQDKYDNIVLVNRVNGGKGKSFALNEGIKYASGELLFFMDADVQLDTTAFRKVASHFFDETVDALTGYIKVSSNKSFLNKFIDFENVIGQKIIRRGFNFLGIHYVIPGGISVFRREIIDIVGGYQHDTLAEDTDIAWRIITETDAKVIFDPSIEVIADEPKMLTDLWNQRVRWARGNIEVTWKNRHKVGRNKYGRGATWVYPFWLGSLLLPFAFILGATGFILTILLEKTPPNILYILTFVLALSFYLLWVIGTFLNNGKSWLAGLLTPGIPMLITITASLFSKNGVTDFLNIFLEQQWVIIISFILGIWILISIPGTYMCLFLANKGKTKFASTIQLLVFGYWMFLVVSIMQGYYNELTKGEKIWIRTIR